MRTLTMASWRHRLVRHVAAFALVALFVVPIASRAHVHGDTASGSPTCAVCVVALHAPADGVARVAHVAPSVVSLRLAGEEPVSPASGSAPMGSGRAPPLPVAAHL
jgi:hypothetical protein